MRIPRELWVNGEHYRVKFVRPENMPCGHTRTSWTWGYTCGESQTIYLLQGLKPKDRLETFFHEMQHAIEFEYGFDIPHELVRALQGPLAQVIGDNIAIRGFSRLM